LYVLFLFLFQFQSSGQTLEGTLGPGQTELEQEFDRSGDLTGSPEGVGTRKRAGGVGNVIDEEAAALNPQMTEAADLCNNTPEGTPPDEENCNRMGALLEVDKALSEKGEEALEIRSQLGRNLEEGEDIGPNFTELQNMIPVAEQILAERGFTRNSEGNLVSPSGQVLPKYTANLTDKQLLAAGYTKASIAATRANEANLKKQKQLAAASGRRFVGPFSKRVQIAVGPFGRSRSSQASLALRTSSKGRGTTAAPTKKSATGNQRRGVASDQGLRSAPQDFRPDELDKLTINFRGTPIGTSGSSVFRVISEAYGNASLYDSK